MSSPPEQSQMPFLEHLTELRGRLIYSAIAVAVGMLACFGFAEPIYGWLVEPLLDALPVGSKRVVFLNPVEPFLVYLKASALAGVLVSSPFCLYQLWKFIAPGLYPREKRAALPFVLFGTVFFVGGALFCRYIVLPLGLRALMGFAFDTKEFAVDPQITMQEYFSVATKMMLAFGVVFEMPVIVLFLSWIRLIDHMTLIRYWRFAIVGSFVVGAMLTPPDIATQALLAGPMMVLYALSIGIAYVFSGKKSEDEDEEGEEDEDEATDLAR